MKKNILVFITALLAVCFVGQVMAKPMAAEKCWKEAKKVVTKKLGKIGSHTTTIELLYKQLKGDLDRLKIKHNSFLDQVDSIRDQRDETNSIKQMSVASRYIERLGEKTGIHDLLKTAKKGISSKDSKDEEEFSDNEEEFYDDEEFYEDETEEDHPRDYENIDEPQEKEVDQEKTAEKIKPESEPEPSAPEKSEGPEAEVKPSKEVEEKEEGKESNDLPPKMESSQTSQDDSTEKESSKPEAEPSDEPPSDAPPGMEPAKKSSEDEEGEGW